MSNITKIIIGGLVLIAIAIYAFGMSDIKRTSNIKQLDNVIVAKKNATNILFEPAVIETKLNEKFTIKVYADSIAGKSYTLKSVFKFSPEQIKAEKWEFAPGWMPIVKSDYDLIDNKNGEIIKTAGFPGGWTGQKLLGTITFSAKSNATGKIVVSDKTFALDADSLNIYSSANEVSVTVLNKDVTVPEKVDNLPVKKTETNKKI